MEIKRIGVVGAGQMGAGIALVAAQSGFEVILNDVEKSRLDQAGGVITQGLDRLVKKEKITMDEKEAIFSRIRRTTELRDFSDVDFVVEAATENPKVKLELFRELDRICVKNAILVSNTSSISITKIANATSRPDRVAGMHFMNPVPLMKLVEGIRGRDTSPETFDQVRKLAEKMGKTFIAVKDSPAFVVNRILVPMLNEAVFVLEQGLATQQDIDLAMKIGCNFPMGPFELLDYVGLDTALAIMEVMHEDLKDPKYRPCPLLRKYVEKGWLGKKSGKGFYEYGNI